MRTYKLAFSITATGANLANLLLMRSGRIKSVSYSTRIDSLVDNTMVDVALSLSPVSNIGTSESIGDFAQWGAAVQFVTSGLGYAGLNGTIPLDVQVGAGERVYLHALVSGTLTAAATTVFISVEERG